MSSGLSFFCLLSFLLQITIAESQIRTNGKYGDGISIVPQDSSFSVTFGARIQPLYSGNTSEMDYRDNFQIRRARLKFDGFLYHPSLTYKIELALSNQDINGGAIPQSGNTANIVLDAYAEWNFYKRWSLLFGQAKLPGNRERVISSQDLQFVDRSELNGNFNLDRDGGLQLLYRAPFINLIGSVSMGEGRNIVVENSGGYDYTFRAEWLPFGAFEDGGDYFSSDLVREQTPKLSIGITFDYNVGATRERGQLGDFLEEPRDLSTWFADAHFKYRGFSALAEFVRRSAPSGPLVLNEDDEVTGAYYTGSGASAQAGYLFRSDFEIAARITHIDPQGATARTDFTQYTIGLSRYFAGHNLKVQTDISLTDEQQGNDWSMYRLQAEISF